MPNTCRNGCNHDRINSSCPGHTMTRLLAGWTHDPPIISVAVLRCPRLWTGGPEGGEAPPPAWRRNWMIRQ